MADQPTPSLIAKIAGAVVAIAAAWAVQKAVNASWKAASGHKPPKADDQGDAGLGEVVAAAAITGALVALSRVLTMRGTARFSARIDEGRRSAAA
ncbi:MAG TPA: DUF4235 domain-containing protein [Cellulomonas sp.]|uniref:DUF4235 domain-containing protein n=1 Tax=Cellulomonas sp. TaxID=40001 RepID=UPI002E330456|nr:DUF4235 domain-containing protein [Cellulomonas sp.]HEX5333476.1 DUF4235 domain-containing protein [Cellulomonas sp.]